jgi:Bacterial Ig domain/WD40-like Beta Propeller Repeat
MRRAFLVFACVVALTAPSAAASDGMLAAVVDQRLITVNADGSGLRTLWAPSGAIGGLAWSPDGNRLAISYDGQIVVWDPAAGRGTAITSGTDPTWAASGIGLRRAQTRAIVGADGRELFAAPLDRRTTAFAWAPNLSDFAAVVGPLLLAPGVELAVSGVRGAPAWSPGGDRLAFADGAGVHVVGAGLVAAGEAGPPRWAPDGRSLVYPAGSELRTVAAAGGDPRTVLAGGTFTAADWQPCTAATMSCESIAPPRCSALALSVTTRAEQAIDLPPEPCGDPAGRPLSLVIVKPPEHGTLEGRRYTPAAGFAGQDGLSYRMSNGSGESETVRVTIFVVPRPATLAAPPLVVVARAPFLSARAKPRLNARRATRVRLSCDQDCRFAVRLTARVRSNRTVKGKLVRRSLKARHVLALRLRLPQKPTGRLKTAWIRGTVRNARGQRRTVKLPVALAR